MNALRVCDRLTVKLVLVLCYLTRTKKQEKQEGSGNHIHGSHRRRWNPARHEPTPLSPESELVSIKEVKITLVRDRCPQTLRDHRDVWPKRREEVGGVDTLAPLARFPTDDARSLGVGAVRGACVTRLLTVRSVCWQVPSMREHELIGTLRRVTREIEGGSESVCRRTMFVLTFAYNTTIPQCLYLQSRTAYNTKSFIRNIIPANMF